MPSKLLLKARLGEPWLWARPNLTLALVLNVSQQRRKSPVEEEYKRNEAVFHSLVVLVLYKLESLIKVILWSFLPSEHHGRQLAVYLPALVGQYLETAIPLYCVNTMGAEVVRLFSFKLKLFHSCWLQGHWSAIEGSTFLIQEIYLLQTKRDIAIGHKPLVAHA